MRGLKLIDTTNVADLRERNHREPYPDIPEGERLFDRQRVATAVSEE